MPPVGLKHHLVSTSRLLPVLGPDLLLIFLLFPACTPPIKQYELKHQRLSCEEANRAAYRSLRAMGFAITAFERAGAGRRGVLKGSRDISGAGERRQEVTVAIDCTATGVSVDAHRDSGWLDQIEFKRGFYHSFTNVVSMTAARAEMDARIAAGTAPASQQRRDLQVLVEPVYGLEAKLHFDFDAAAGGVLPVRISIRNLTAHSYSLQPAEIRLTRADRERVEALSPEEAAARIARAPTQPGAQAWAAPLSVEAIAASLRTALLTATEVKPQAQTSGYLYFPLADYTRARVVLTERESGEAEGFLVEF